MTGTLVVVFLVLSLIAALMATMHKYSALKHWRDSDEPMLGIASFFEAERFTEEGNRYRKLTLRWLAYYFVSLALFVLSALWHFGFLVGE